MVTAGLRGVIDSIERLEPFIDVGQLFDYGFIARKRHEVNVLDFYSPELSPQIRATGSAVIAAADTGTFLSADDISNISIGHASRTREMLLRHGD